MEELFMRFFDVRVERVRHQCGQNSKFQCRSKFHTHLKVLDFLRVL